MQELQPKSVQMKYAANLVCKEEDKLQRGLDVATLANLKENSDLQRLQFLE